MAEIISDTTNNINWNVSAPAGPYPTGGYGAKKKKSGPSWIKNSITLDETTTAPDWWSNKAARRGNTNVSILNSLIPYLSPEDQNTLATSLYQSYPDRFKEYAKVTPAQTEDTLSTKTTDWFTSAERAQQALATLQQVAKVRGKKESSMGAGYRFLKNYLDIMSQYGGGESNRQTRKQYLEMSNALSNLLSMVKGTSAEAFSSVAQMLSNPTFTVAGNVTKVSSDTTTGEYQFGAPNPTLYA